MIEHARSATCVRCGATIAYTVVAHANVDLDATVYVADLVCPAHLSDEKRALLAERPAAERGKPDRRSHAAPCRGCGANVGATVLLPEGVTGTVGTPGRADGPRHVECPKV